MKIFAISFLTILLFLGNYYRAPKKKADEVDDQNVRLKEVVISFNASLKAYSQQGDADSFGKILQLNDSEDPQQNVANDLPSEDDKKSVGYVRYLINLKKSNTQLDYDNVQVLDCNAITQQTTKGNSDFKLVAYDKIIIGSGSRKVKEVALVNTTTYKIGGTFLADDSSKNTGICHDEVASLVQGPQIINSPAVLTASKYKIAIKQADALFNDKQYEPAETQYKLIQNKFPADSKKNKVEDKIAQTETAIQIESNNNFYIKMMACANYYFDKALFNRAKEFYEYALTYKPEDAEATSGVSKCQNNSDLHVVKTEIQEARLQMDNQSNYGKVYKTFAEVEPCGLLTTADYYFMIENLYEKNPVILKEMNYSEEECENYLNIYRYKLRMTGEREKQKEIKNDVMGLLGDIIISENTSHVYVRTIKYYPKWVIHTRNNRPIIINPNKSGYVRHISAPIFTPSVPVVTPNGNQPNVGGKKPSFFNRLGNKILNNTTPQQSPQQPVNSQQPGNGQLNAPQAAPPPKKESFFKKLDKLVSSLPNSSNSGSNTNSKKTPSKEKKKKK